MLDPLSENSQCQRFNPRHGLCAGTPVCHHAWNLWNLRDPAPIFLFLDFDGKSHDPRRISEKR